MLQKTMILYLSITVKNLIGDPKLSMLERRGRGGGVGEFLSGSYNGLEIY